MRFRSLPRLVRDATGEPETGPWAPLPPPLACPARLAVLFESQLLQHRRLFASLGAVQAEIAAAAGLMARTLQHGGRLFVFGNGVSASDSQNLAAELSGRLRNTGRAGAACALSGHGAALMCLTPDQDYSDVFARQLALVAQPGDCALGLSISGRSPNVLRAFETARALQMATVALLGGDGACARPLVDLSVAVTHRDGARVREVHLFITQLWCRQIEALLEAP